eukprot:scaffold7380_cov350-Prasinococcus_capsulatus_cf.AAC.1
MVEGRIAKRLKELALLEQPFIKDQDKTVGEVVKEAVASIGENIKVRRFERFNLGEGLEKKEEDFAAEVAKASEAAAPAPPPAPAPEEKEEEAGPAVAVSAKDVKQLREATGCGMMDCKKALKECGGDMEAAATFLRQK